MLQSKVNNDGWALDDGSRTGVAEYLHYDDVEKIVGRELVQDIEPILNDVKARANELNAGKNQGKDFYLAGRFPVVLVENWLKLRGLTMQDFKHTVIDDFLNDPDHSAFRVWQGRV